RNRGQWRAGSALPPRRLAAKTVAGEYLIRQIAPGGARSLHFGRDDRDKERFSGFDGYKNRFASAPSLSWLTQIEEGGRARVERLLASTTLRLCWISHVCALCKLLPSRVIRPSLNRLKDLARYSAR